MPNDQTPIIKPYPMPDPAVPGSSSAFSRRNGQGQMYLAILEPECPVYADFDKDKKTGKWMFREKLDKNGAVIKQKHKRIAPYIPSEALRELVRLAQILQRPVLLKGEPGSGKTQLARSVAFEWYRENYRKHYFEWHIKSTSKAVDGLYTIDHISRLRDTYDRTKTEAQVNDMTRYRKFGEMGKAFLTSTRENPSILLIDEIDKADIDFPNDLLLELDEMRFKIQETKEEFPAGYPPVVFITSNDERELPEAFLRRCLFMYIKFPSDEDMKNIIRAHLPDLMAQQDAFVKAASEAAVATIYKDDKEYKDALDKQQFIESKKKDLFSFVDFALRRFNMLRKSIEGNPSDNKRISTSELLDWLRAYQFDLIEGLDPKTAERPEAITAWIAQYEKDRLEGVSDALVKTGLIDLPFYYQALLKTFAAAKDGKKIDLSR